MCIRYAEMWNLLKKCYIYLAVVHSMNGIKPKVKKTFGFCKKHKKHTDKLAKLHIDKE